jgi:hypothetical protein
MSSASDAIQTASSPLDLYDFFSMLLPGAALLIGLLPFLPQKLPVDAVGSAVILLIGGYVVGRALHTAAESLDQIFNEPSHRDVFVSTLQSNSPSILDMETRDSFYFKATEEFNVSLPSDRTQASDESLSALYVRVRSLLYRGSRARSQTFQAVFAFYRSIHLAAQIIVLCYFFYGIGEIFDLFNGVGSFTTYIGALGLQPNVFLLAAEVILGLSLLTFKDAKSDYREYFIEYLFVDYLTMR